MFARILICALLFSGFAVAQDMTVDQIVEQLTLAHLRNRAAQPPHTATRTYLVTKSGDDRAALTAILHREAPSELSFQIVDSTGGMAEKAVRKSLEKEVQLTREPTISEVSSRNYSFELLGRETLNGNDCYVLKITPHERSKDLVEGKIWVDTRRYLIRQLEGSPSRNPSWWVKDLDLKLTFGEIEGIWLQLRSEVKLHIRLAGDYVVHAQNTSLLLMERPVEVAQKQRLFRRITPTAGVFLRPGPGMQR